MQHRKKGDASISKKKLRSLVPFNIHRCRQSSRISGPVKFLSGKASGFDYEVVNENTLKVQTKAGLFTYLRCSEG